MTQQNKDHDSYVEAKPDGPVASEDLPVTAHEDDDDEDDVDTADEERSKMDWPRPRFKPLGSVVKFLSETALDVFFSRIEVVNSENIPDEGPVILFGNHFNQFVDAMVMMRAAQRPVSFVIAESSMHRPIIGDCARMLDAVPVIRPQDRAKDGPGVIKSIDLKSRTIKGEKTAFQSIEQGFMITIKDVGQFALEAASSDTEMTFKELPKDDDTDVNPVNNEDAGTPYKITPKIQHSEMFDEIHKKLDEGGCVGIFPEGGSHDRTELLPFKVGVAIMALQARMGGTPVTLVPVGINYYSGHVFRSKVFVDCGKPIPISKKLVDMYGKKETRRQACSELLQDMQQALDFVCLTAPDFETLKAMRTARRMYQNKVELSAKEYVDLNQRFSYAYHLWKDKPEIKSFLHDVLDYLEHCRAQGLTDKEVRDLEPLGSARTLLNATSQVLTTVGMMGFVLPVIAPGVLLNLPIPLYVRYKVPKAMKKAVETSTVKIKARDVAASQSIMLAMKMVPALHLFYSGLWLVFFKFAWPYLDREPGSWGSTFVENAKWILPPCFLFFGPYYSFYICPTLGEALMRRVRLLPRYLLTIRAFFSTSKRQPAEELRVEREKLVVRIQNFVEENIKDIPDWNKSRVINRAKVLKARSDSMRNLARGDLRSAVPVSSNDNFEVEEAQLERYSFSSE